MKVNKDGMIYIPTIGLIIYLVYTNKLYIKCIFKRMTHLYCPGCGITRCLISILKMDFYQAFRYNPLVFILLPFLISYLFYKLYIIIFNKENVVIKKIPSGFYYLLLIVTIIFGILRNTTSFSWLAPTTI